MFIPSYTWVCHKCKATNSANGENCSSCGYFAGAAREDPGEDFPQPGWSVSKKSDDLASSETTNKPDPTTWRVVLFVYGIFLVFSGINAIAEEEWPSYLPSFLDVLGLIVGAWWSPAGAVTAGWVVLFFGFAFCIFALFGNDEKPR